MSSSSVIRVFRGCRALLASAKSSTPKTASSSSSATAAAKPKAKPTAAAKPKAKPTAAEKPKAKPTAAAKPKAKPKAPSNAAVKAKTKRPVSAETKAARIAAISKEIPVSPVFGSFLGVPEVSRPGALKKIWDYVKTNNLQNPANKREIVCDEKLKTIFDGKETVGIMEVPKLLSTHFVKTS